MVQGRITHPCVCVEGALRHCGANGTLLSRRRRCALCAAVLACSPAVLACGFHQGAVVSVYSGCCGLKVTVAMARGQGVTDSRPSHDAETIL